MDCLTGVVGVTNVDCECATGSLTPDQKAELSASSANFYYLDNIPTSVDLATIRSKGTCRDFYQFSTDALRSAINTLSDDITAALAMKYPQKQGAYHGSLGRTTFSGNLPAKKPLQFMRVNAISSKSDAVLSFNRVKLFSNVVGTTTFYVLDRDLKVLHQVDNIALNANTFTLFSMPEKVVLPLYHENGDATYYFAWENIAGGMPKDNKVSCGCSGGDGWNGYVNVVGGEADNMDDLLSVRTDNRTHGIVIEGGELRCVTSKFVCREYDDKDAIAVVSKWAVAYKANEILVESILASRQVDRFTLMDREHLYGKRNHYRSEYQNRVQYIVDHVDTTSNSCFLCKDRRINLSGIMA